MKLRITTLLGTTAAAAFVASAAFAQSAAPYPAMSASIAANGAPLTLDLGVLGSKVTVGGVVSGLAYVQNNHVPGDNTSAVDLSNAQVFINKSDGMFQYFVQAGTYSFPNLSPFAYLPSAKTPNAFFGSLPQGFIKIVPNSMFSIEAGALPTLVGDEYGFTFENLNIERGMLWNLEPLVSRGVQANLAYGPISASLAWTDGFYSNRYNTISGLVTWTINSTNTLAFDFETPTDFSPVNYTPTFPVLNNERIYNLMYTHTMGPWVINPYLQYTELDAHSTGPIQYGKETTFGAALLVNYAFDSKGPLAGVSIPVRVEYLSADGSAISGAPQLLFGPGSDAWSVTVTPTYQYKQYFIRGEVSYTSANKTTNPFGPPDFGYGQESGFEGNQSDQTRAMVETGVAF